MHCYHLDEIVFKRERRATALSKKHRPTKRQLTPILYECNKSRLRVVRTEAKAEPNKTSESLELSVTANTKHRPTLGCDSSILD